MIEWLAVALLLVLDLTVWIVVYRRSTETGVWRVIDANLVTSLVNCLVILFALVVAIGMHR